MNVLFLHDSYYCSQWVKILFRGIKSVTSFFDKQPYEQKFNHVMTLMNIYAKLHIQPITNSRVVKTS